MDRQERGVILKRELEWTRAGRRASEIIAEHKPDLKSEALEDLMKEFLFQQFKEIYL